MPQDLSQMPQALYLSQQIREAELLAVESGQVTLYELVERAGDAAFRILKKLYRITSPILVVPGSGNNGADGYVCGRLLLEAGCDVVMMPLNDSLKTEEVTLAKQSFLDAGGNITDWNPELMQGAKVIIDGLLGTGLSGNLKEEYVQAIEQINLSSAWVLSLDVPSGINADTGSANHVAVEADATITFGALKQGLFTARARHCCGHLEYADVGFSDFLPAPVALRVNSEYLVNLPDSRARDSHKGMSGKVTVIGGDTGMAGAVRLAGEACLRSGAGLVTVVSRPEHQLTVNANRPELMFWGCELVDMEVYLRLGWASVLVLGPGLGKHDWGYNLFKATCLSDKPCVLDADALNLLAIEPKRQDNWVLTPHSGEAARLLDCDIAEVEADRFAAVKALQQKYGGVVLLKGAGTLIYDGKQLWVAPVGNPGLASGGCGDVLSGIIGALMAQGLDNATATATGVIIHGNAADLAAKDGERGMLASDLMPYIRQLVNRELS